MSERLRPGAVRDAIIESLSGAKALTTAEVYEAVNKKLGREVAKSSVRSYLNLNTPETFECVERGRYRLRKAKK